MPEQPIPEQPEQIWSFRGYQLNSNSFMTALAHLYRAEVQRSSAWRNRLDVTTNWAIIVTGAAISFAFAEPDVHHSAMFLFALLITLFLFIEARRYQHYELWSYRARLVETDFYAAMLIPPFQAHKNWAEDLAKSLLRPTFPITFISALGHRLRNNYIWIYIVLEIAWIGKLALYPESIYSLNELLDRARIGQVEGGVVLLIQGLLLGLAIFIAIATRAFQNAQGEMIQQNVEIIVRPEDDAPVHLPKPDAD